MSSNISVTCAQDTSVEASSASTVAPLNAGASGVVPPPRINPVPREAEQLVRLAVDGLAASAGEHDPNERFIGAQLAALRAAAALVAVRSRAASRSEAMARGRALNVWQLLARVAPEFAEWAALFLYGADRRAAVAAGTADVTSREADDTLRDAAKFVAAVARRLGVPSRRLDLTAEWLAVS